MLNFTVGPVQSSDIVWKIRLIIIDISINQKVKVSDMKLFFKTIQRGTDYHYIDDNVTKAIVEVMQDFINHKYIIIKKILK